MKNTRVVLRILASTLATAGIVLGVASASVAAPASLTSQSTSFSHMNPMKDTGW